MTKVFIVYDESEYGEVEGAFDESGELIDFWSANDAAWRNEYFSPFLKRLGIETKTSQDQKLKGKLGEAAFNAWG